MNSFWTESTKNIEKNYSPINKNIEVDVCIIGAGLTGLTSAYFLSDSNLKVAVLERSKVCSHVSANSTAKITSQHNLFYDYLINSNGLDYAKGYLNANEDAVRGIQDIIKKENLNCDLEKQDSYVYAVTDTELENIKKELEAVSILDFPCEFEEKLPLPIQNLGAIKFPNQAQFNPRKYALGLCDIITKKGINIYENSIVTDVSEENEYYIVSVNDNKVKAKNVILATHYPIINFPGFYFLKMYQSMSYVIAVDTKCELPSGMYINNEIPTYSFRTTPYKNKRLLIVAGSDHKVGEKINLDNAYEILERKVKEIYPQSEVLFKWCTEDCISLDKIPYIGDFSSIMPNLYVATGFKKWGITFSYVASKIITDKILGIENPYEDLFKATRLEAIKNHEELGNMIKESIHSLVINKLKESPDTLEDVNINEGKIIELEGNKVGVYRDESGQCFFIKPVCAHLRL